MVDDEAAITDPYVTRLGDEYDVATAADGEAALAAATGGFDPDVILLDRRMPGPSGDETAARLRAADCGARVALVTAVDPALDIADLPVDAYLTKPVDGATLRATVADLLALSSYDEAARTRFRLSRKLAAIVAVGPGAEAAGDEAFAALEAAVRRARRAAVDAAGGFDHGTAAAAFGELPPSPCGSRAGGATRGDR